MFCMKNYLLDEERCMWSFTWFMTKIMGSKKYGVICTVLFLCIAEFGHAQATFTVGNSNAEILARLSGPGLILSNANLESGNRTSQIGLFTNGIAGANLELDQGIILSTGSIIEAMKFNEKIVSSERPGSVYNDPDIVLIDPTAINDVVVFSFDVTLSLNVNKITVDYQFGSDEYPDYVGSIYNDVFGFFVSGGDLPGTSNIAIVPGTTNPVAVNSINAGFLGAQGRNGTSNTDLSKSAYYINNGHDLDGSTSNTNSRTPTVFIEYNGITKRIVGVIAGLTPGLTYTFKMAIADTGDAGYDSAVFINQISATGPINAIAETFPVINGEEGGSTASVLANDLLSGIAVAFSEINLTGVSVPTGLTLNADGTITVAPGTTPGTYEVEYKICEKLDSSNCDTAISKVVVVPVIAAVTETFPAINGKDGGDTTSVLTNDTLNGAPVVLAEINLTGVSVPTGLTLNADGTVSVAPGMAAGTYEVEYKICEKLNPTNCDTVISKVVVSASVIDAQTETFPAINGNDGGDTTSVLTNDTLNGAPVVLAEINLTGVSVPTGLTLNSDGTVSVAPGMAAGTYNVEYKICEKLNPTNCDTVISKVVVSAAVIAAVTENIPAINGGIGGTSTVSVFTNDILNGVAVDVLEINATHLNIPRGISLNSNGTITVLAGTLPGDYNIEYSICEVLNPTNCDTVISTITVLNTAPIAVGDTYSGNEDAISIKGNVITTGENQDVDIDGDSLSVATYEIDGSTYTIGAVHTITEGAIRIDSNGDLTFVPASNYNGTVPTITYTLSDGVLTDTTDIVITVNPVADNTIAVDDTVSVDEDASVEINVVANDTDDDGNATVNSPVDTFTQPANGTTELNANGTIKYTPNADFNGTDTFTYINKDGETATVTVTVNPTNDAPVAEDDTVEIQEGEAIVINVIQNDEDSNDPSGGIDPTSVTIISQPANGTVTVDATTGEVTYTPDTGYYGSDTFEYSVCDTGNPLPPLCDTATVSITIQSFELINDSINITEDTTGVINVLANDEDPSFIIDTASLVIFEEPANGVVSVNTATGEITYTPNADFNGVDIYQYQVCSTSTPSVCKTAMVTVTVIDELDTKEDVVETKEDEVLEIQVLENDEFTGGVLVTAVSNPENGSIIFTDDGVVIYTPDENFNGEEKVIYTVTIVHVDGTTTEETGEIIITVLPVNDPPVAEDDEQVVGDGEREVIIEIRDNDYDLDGDKLFIEGITSPANGAVILNDDGTVTYVPNAEFVGVDSFEYEICDGSGDCVIASVSITVEINDIVTPNAFSPNGDGHNDLFIIKGLLEKYPNFKMEIFNRWGNIVYDYTHNGNTMGTATWWNGKSSGRMTLNSEKVLPTGTYYYVIHFNDQKRAPYQNWVYLIK
ncbi:MAG: hypothetical protein COB98_09145 [Flavobacteriaceae bacterium]|nr:MAG: hypothetical protein COB98_09145 [Flavobacteriaceae bacterium]